MLAYGLTYDCSTVQHGHTNLGQRGGENSPYLSCYGDVDRAPAAFARPRGSENITTGGTRGIGNLYAANLDVVPNGLQDY